MPANGAAVFYLGFSGAFGGAPGVLRDVLRVCARWTHNHLWVALGDWANRNGFKLRRAKRGAGSPVSQAAYIAAAVRVVSLVGRRTTIVQIETPAPDGAATGPQRWNVLVREIKVDWPPTALRPALHERSLIDLFRLSSFPALLSSERYTLHGIDAAAAAAVVSSVLMGLLPHDLGMLLYGKRLVLDFSTRPFDGIELSRMVSLVEQLVERLPEKKAARKR